MDAVEIGTKVYFNGFPKAGLHLAVLMGSYLANPWIATHSENGKPLDDEIRYHWCGTFTPAWTTTWRKDWDKIENHINLQPQGSWIKGHLGYKPELEELIFKNGQAFVFVYRDLRDVAVSATHHIEDQRTKKDDGRELIHPGKEEYMELPTHADRLMAVICGLNDWPGLFDRWELYAPWLDVDWVFPARYEYMLNHRRWIVELFIRYVFERTINHHELDMAYPAKLHDVIREKTLEVMTDTSRSETYRKGVTGEWRHEFTPEIKAAFKERAGDWLIRLGYEKGNDW